MLEMRPNCECCDVDLKAEEATAFICSFECTYCASCADKRLDYVCPNCTGPLVARPVRAAALQQNFPASTQRVVRSSPCPG